MGFAKVSDALTAYRVAEEVISQFRTIVGDAFVIVDAEGKSDYAHDKTEDYFFLPDVVLKPRSSGEVSQIVKICNTHRIPLTPRGAGTGLSGGALPVKKGVVLSCRRR